MNDPYLEKIDARWQYIAAIYNEFRDKQPIIEYHVNSEQIYSYPAKDYINNLSARTQEQTKIQYHEACKSNQFLFFVRDENNQKLKSYIFDTPQHEA